MGVHSQRFPIGNRDLRPCQVQRDDRRLLLQRGRQHDRDLVVLPRMQVDDMSVGEQLGHSGGEDPEVRPRVLGGLGSGVPGDPDDLAHSQVAVLGQLAEEAHRTVLQVRKRAVGRAGGPEAAELLHRIGSQVDRGDAYRDPGIAELGDLLGQQRPAWVGISVVPAPALDAVESLGESADVRGIGKVGRAGDEQRPAILRAGESVDPGAPLGQRGTVGL